MIESYRGVAFAWMCDQMGHLTTSRYVEMFDVAAYHLADRLGLGLDSIARIGLADVRHEIDYRSEVPVGGLVMIRSGLLATGRSSYRARHIMTDATGSVEHAVMTAVTVRFDLAARKSIPLGRAVTEMAAPLLIGE
jgi:acyl-CoA thioester hydrolase